MTAVPATYTGGMGMGEREQISDDQWQTINAMAALSECRRQLDAANARADEAEREVARLRSSAATALSALDNYGQHHSWCDERMRPNSCPCRYTQTVIGLQVTVFAEQKAAEVRAALTPEDTQEAEHE